MTKQKIGRDASSGRFTTTGQVSTVIRSAARNSDGGTRTVSVKGSSAESINRAAKRYAAALRRLAEK